MGYLFLSPSPAHQPCECPCARRGLCCAALDCWMQRQGKGMHGRQRQRQGKARQGSPRPRPLSVAGVSAAWSFCVCVCDNVLRCQANPIGPAFCGSPFLISRCFGMSTHCEIQSTGRSVRDDVHVAFLPRCTGEEEERSIRAKGVRASVLFSVRRAVGIPKIQLDVCVPFEFFFLFLLRFGLLIHCIATLFLFLLEHTSSMVAGVVVHRNSADFTPCVLTGRRALVGASVKRENLLALHFSHSHATTFASHIPSSSGME